jgi:hypothetical protein
MTCAGKTDAMPREWGKLPGVIHRIPPFRSLTGPDQRLDSLGRHLRMMGENLEHDLDHARDRRLAIKPAPEGRRINLQKRGDVPVMGGKIALPPHHEAMMDDLAQPLSRHRPPPTPRVIPGATLTRQWVKAPRNMPTAQAAHCHAPPQSA